MSGKRCRGRHKGVCCNAVEIAGGGCGGGGVNADCIGVISRIAQIVDFARQSGSDSFVGNLIFFHVFGVN